MGGSRSGDNADHLPSLREFPMVADSLLWTAGTNQCVRVASLVEPLGGVERPTCGVPFRSATVASDCQLVAAPPHWQSRRLDLLGHRLPDRRTVMRGGRHAWVDSRNWLSLGDDRGTRVFSLDHSARSHASPVRVRQAGRAIPFGDRRCMTAGAEVARIEMEPTAVAASALSWPTDRTTRVNSPTLVSLRVGQSVWRILHDFHAS